jgi:hypothetical protein
MSTCEVRLFVPKGGFTAYVSGMTVADEIFCAAHPKFVWVFNANCDETIIYNDPVGILKMDGV